MRLGLKTGAVFIDWVLVKLSCGHDVPDKEILRVAGLIRWGMRRTKATGRPLKQVMCPHCSQSFMGHALLNAHLALCPAPPPQPVTDEDLRAIAWPPEDAA